MEIDFGTCTTSDGIVRSVRVASFSKLINRIGFVDQPDYVSVAPGDGFATLLPLESIDQEITFAPKIPGTYRFTLSVKTMDGRCAFIKCRGVANKPPMRFMSHAGNFRMFTSR